MLPGDGRAEHCGASCGGTRIPLSAVISPSTRPRSATRSAIRESRSLSARLFRETKTEAEDAGGKKRASNPAGMSNRLPIIPGKPNDNVRDIYLTYLSNLEVQSLALAVQFPAVCSVKTTKRRTKMLI